MTVLLQKYEVERVLGKGNFGKVVLARNQKTGQQAAIKQISKARLQKQAYLIPYLEGEIECMQNIKSPYVMELLEVSQDTENKYLVCGYCNAGNLLQYQFKMPNRVIPLKKTLQIIAMVTKGLQEIHENGYLHRDIKPENVLVEKNGDVENFRIADFGFARREDKISGTILGTGKFMAPEIYKDEKYGYGVDMWALGVTIYFMLNSEYPFNPAPKRQILDIQAKLPFSYSQMVKRSHRKIMENCNEQTEHLFARMFELDPNKRISFHELKEHPLLKEYFPQDEAYQGSKVLYNKAYNGGEKQKPIDKIQEYEEDEDTHHVKSSIVPKANYTKQIEQLEFYFQHKEFIHNLSSYFRSEGRYLKTFIKFALRYNLLKFYIFEAKKLLNQLKNKKLPDQANTHLNWETFFKSKEASVLISNLESQIQVAEGEFEASYFDCKANYDEIVKEIPDFKDSFHGQVTQTHFDEFKKGYRAVTSKANKELTLSQNQLGNNAPGLIQLRIRIFLCHILNQVFNKDDLKDNFKEYFAWKKKQDLEENPNEFNFESFTMWISKESKENLIKTITFIMKKYFG